MSQLSWIPRLAKALGRTVDETPVIEMTDPEAVRAGGELRNLVAQHNARELLGLGPENTAMERAAALGFDVDQPWYHGSAEDIESFDPAWSEMTTGNNPHEAFFFTDDPSIADDYSRQAFIRRYQDNAEQLLGKGIVDELPSDPEDYDAIYPFVEELAEEQIKNTPSLLKIFNPYVRDWGGERLSIEEADAIAGFVKKGYDESGLIDMDDIYSQAKFDAGLLTDYKNDILEYAQDYYGVDKVEDIEDHMRYEALTDLGFEPEMPSYDTVLHRNVIDDISEQSAFPHDQMVVFNPANIRSRFAAFDPAAKDSPMLLRGAAPVTLAPALLDDD